MPPNATQARLASALCQRLVDKLLLEPPHFVSKFLDLFPAVQRCAVIDPQAANDIVLGLFHTLVDRLEFLPALELLSKGLNVSLYALPAQVAKLLSSGGGVVPALLGVFGPGGAFS